MIEKIKVLFRQIWSFKMLNFLMKRKIKNLELCIDKKFFLISYNKVKIESNTLSIKTSKEIIENLENDIKKLKRNIGDIEKCLKG